MISKRRMFQGVGSEFPQDLVILQDMDGIAQAISSTSPTSTEVAGFTVDIHFGQLPALEEMTGTSRSISLPGRMPAKLSADGMIKGRTQRATPRRRPVCRGSGFRGKVVRQSSSRLWRSGNRRSA